jgi:hypothetical protein
MLARHASKALLLTTRLLLALLPLAARGGASQTVEHGHAPAPVPLQPLAQQVRLLERALSYLGQPLPPAAHERINRATAGADVGANVNCAYNPLADNKSTNTPVNQ